ncbi:MAG: hypothetical protein Q8P59_08770, partial [Dehalococcoidia bacterium]|nr:hypothetical protein [Dehalococcoidia bacterium]
MPEQSNWDALVMPVLAPLASVVAALVIAWLLNLLLGRLARRLAQKAGTNFYGAILSAARWPIAAAIILVGVYQAALLSPWTGKWYPYMVEGFLTLLVLVGIFGAAAVLSAVLRWYAEEVAASARTRLSYVLAAALRIIVPLAAVALALLIGLEAMGIRSEPVNTWLLEHGGRTAFIIVLVLVALLVVEQAVPPMVASTLAWRREELEEEARKRTDTLARTLVTSVQVAAVLVAAFMVIAEVGVNIGPILA